jgi:hypothetical protein
MHCMMVVDSVFWYTLMAKHNMAIAPCYALFHKAVTARKRDIDESCSSTIRTNTSTSKESPDSNITPRCCVSSNWTDIVVGHRIIDLYTI